MTDEERWDDPEFVLGAVLAQLEDLTRDEKLAVLAQAAEAVEDDRHAHEWVDMRNEYVQSGEWCHICNAVRAGNEATGTIGYHVGPRRKGAQ